jgi:hypothetical protein
MISSVANKEPKRVSRGSVDKRGVIEATESDVEIINSEFTNLDQIRAIWVQQSIYS